MSAPDRTVSICCFLFCSVHVYRTLLNMMNTNYAALWSSPLSTEEGRYSSNLLKSVDHFWMGMVHFYPPTLYTGMELGGMHGNALKMFIFLNRVKQYVVFEHINEHRLSFKSLGSLRNVLVFERKAAFFYPLK